MAREYVRARARDELARMRLGGRYRPRCNAAVHGGGGARIARACARGTPGVAWLTQVKSALLTTTGLLLSTAVLATGCGGGGSDTMRATLTDDGCTYEGDTTPAPGLYTIEVENKTSHFAIFELWALAPGMNVEDVQHAFERATRLRARQGAETWDIRRSLREREWGGHRNRLGSNERPAR